MRALITLIFISVFNISLVLGQELNFEGEIHYKIEYTYFPGNSTSLKDKLPTSIHVYVRDNLVCRQGPTTLQNGYLIEIINLAKNQGYFGWKYNNGSAYRRTTSTDITNDYVALPLPVNIEYLNETKNFGGFVGKKALVFMDNNSEPYTVYYTNQIPTAAFSVYQNLKGFPLYYEGSMNGILFKVYATSVSPKPQPDARFTMPTEYKLLSKEEFNAFMRAQ
jgi:hypothetical protein